MTYRGHPKIPRQLERLAQFNLSELGLLTDPTEDSSWGHVQFLHVSLGHEDLTVERFTQQLQKQHQSQFLNDMM